MKKIYLASGSPRRKALLQQLLGNNFDIIKSDYEEDNTLNMPPYNWRSTTPCRKEGI